MAGPRRVVVTGAAGNLGRKAVAALAGQPEVEVWALDRQAPAASTEARFNAADLERYDPSWTQVFEGAACVLHLAADPKPISDWGSVLRLNVDLSLNVLRAAEAAGIERIVFASSNWVFGGYRFKRDRLTSALPPKPLNPYGASKLFVERCGRSLAEHSGTGFLALRIGYCQPGENRPGPHMAFGRWGQEMWLGNRDWAQAVVRSVTAPFTGFAAINIVSKNDGMRWDVEEARRAIGYVPEEEHAPRQDAANRIRDNAARLRDRWLPTGGSVPLFGARW